VRVLVNLPTVATAKKYTRKIVSTHTVTSRACNTTELSTLPPKDQRET
jgi:hypothetical protein